ncbi:hypothetical protein BCR42DRAFT_127549 [Absidia repens]|uniref:BZIP domain-containing protein n=1 Tax=Absidia repens TaxID=90262 RepID=A0A1X2IVB5_9FUNG|nr:hypothetical protein BCR42DRAFT_127549 [Absidia repens]
MKMTLVILILQSMKRLFSFSSFTFLGTQHYLIYITLMGKPELQPSSCVFGADDLDDWLESDLRQSGILPSKSNKGDRSREVSKYNNWGGHSFCDGSDDKTEVGDCVVDHTKNDTASSSTQLAPILKTFFTTLQHHQPQQYQQARVSPIHNTKTSTTITTVTTTKRHREMNDTPGMVDVLDTLVLKRLKNTDAARRSRQRKLKKMEGLQSRVAELETHNKKLQSQVTMAENGRDAAKVKESRQRERVTTLEAQLAEAHQSLLVKQEPLGQEKLGVDGDSQCSF